jgi:CheY-like chemotaxis protein
MKNIVVADDDTFAAEALALRLNLFIPGSRIITAVDGAEAVKVLNSMPVDLVLTDINMPVMNGYELIEHCRKQYPRTLLAAMTADYTPEVFRRLHALGVPTCFEKPFDFDEVAERVRDELNAGRGVSGRLSGLVSAAMDLIRN